MIDCEHPARRLRCRFPSGGSVSFSVGSEVSDREAIEAHRRVALRIAKGFSRRIVSIDGMPGPKLRLDPERVVFVPVKTPGLTWRRLVWASRVAASYLEMWLIVAHRHTIGRRSVLEEMEKLDAGKWEAV